MKQSQKAAIAAILSLSAVAAAAPLIRLAPLKAHKVTDVTWSTFWLIVESAIIMTMGCIPSFRELFTIAKPSPGDKATRRRRRRLFQARNSLERIETSPRDMEELGQVPSTPRSTIRTQCRRTTSSIGAKSIAHFQAESGFGDLPPLPLNKDEIYINRVFQISSKRVCRI